MFYHLVFPTNQTTLYPRAYHTIPYAKYLNLRNMANESQITSTNKFNLSSMAKIGSHIQYKSKHDFKFRFIYIHALTLFVLILCTLFYVRVPISAMSSLVILSKIPVFFLLAPAPLFKYLYDSYLFGLMIIPIVTYEFRKAIKQEIQTLSCRSF